ncbi:MAG: GNAT family N-acetyltransferase [Streptosporangiaceae bacterium]|nr:GNAT family N-acetyltransferase [Streptosporangiaceae bacterium]
MATPAITPAPPDSPDARRVLKEYFTEVMSRGYGRPVTEAEVDAWMHDEEPSDSLVPPTGLLLVARDGDTVLGCVALRLLGDGIGEIARVFVVPQARGRGLGRRLLDAVEDAARGQRLSTLRLDTGSHLVEANRLYASAGYRQVPAFHDNYQISDRWYEKTLASG